MSARVVQGFGAFSQADMSLRANLGLRARLLVSDVPAYADGVPHVAWFSNFGANPDSSRCRARSRVWRPKRRVDSIIALGGGSSLDCAKAINFLLTNGGRMRDYRGYGKGSQADAADDRHPDDGGNGQ